MCPPTSGAAYLWQITKREAINENSDTLANILEEREEKEVEPNEI